jgi:hypothetical protein
MNGADQVASVGQSAKLLSTPNPRHETEQAIARDLERCDIIAAMGTPSQKRRARAHRKACFAQIAAWNCENGGGETMSDAELLAELGASV